MKLLVIGPAQSAQAQSTEAQARQALQAEQVERYVSYTPRAGEGKVKAALRILSEVEQEEFDTVSAQDPFFIGMLAWYVARRHRARFNVQVHADLDGQSFVRHILAHVVLRHADSVRVVSERIKGQVVRMGVVAPVMVLPLYVDISRFKAVERRPERMVLWVGRFEEEKDPLLALTILKQVDAKLVMLGKGSLEQTLKGRAAGMDVEFPGWQDPLPYLARATAVLCTSPTESWGLSIVEALAAGVPVVSLDVGIAREAGAIVVPRHELAGALRSALDANVHGELKLTLLPEGEWVKRWKESLYGEVTFPRYG